MSTATTDASLDSTTYADVNVLTHSCEQAYKTCPRKFYLTYRLGLRPRWDSEPLRLGSAFHAGLEALKSGKSSAEAVAHVHELYRDAECPPYLTADDFATEEHTAAALVAGYAAKYARDMIVSYIAVELPFSLPIINPETGRETPTFRTAGRIDGIVKLPDDRVALLEHKTTGESIEAGADYWRKLLMDSQVSRYVLAARALGYEVETTVYDVVRKPAIRPKQISKADRTIATGHGHYFGVQLAATCPERETPELYGARLLDDLKQRPDFYFARMEVPRLDGDLTEFQREQWILQQQIRDADLKARHWGASAFPRNTGACLSPYRCQFFDVCKNVTQLDNDNIPDGFKRAERLHGELVA